MPFPVKDLDEVFENAERCVKAYYSFTPLGKNRTGFVLVAGIQSYRSIVDDETKKEIEGRIGRINDEAVKSTGRRRLIEFEGWLDVSQLASWS